MTRAHRSSSPRRSSPNVAPVLVEEGVADLAAVDAVDLDLHGGLHPNPEFLEAVARVERYTRVQRLLGASAAAVRRAAVRRALRRRAARRERDVAVPVAVEAFERRFHRESR